MTAHPAADYIVDCRGTLCPMPIIRLRQAIDKMNRARSSKYRD